MKRERAAAARQRFGQLVADTLVAAILEELPQLVDRRVAAAVAAIPVLRHVGTYDPARAYTEQEVVTADGSMWVARSGSIGIKPGTDAGAASWQLVVKRGKDGRNA